MRSPTPLEKAIIRAVQKGADTRDKLVKELRYFDRADVETAVNRLIQLGALESKVKGVIRKTEKLRVTPAGLEMEKLPSASLQPGEVAATTPRVASTRRSRARALASAGSVAARGVSVAPQASRFFRDEEEEEELEEEEEEERRKGLLDTLKEEIEEVREEVEDAVETIEEEIEEVIDEDEEEEH